MIVPYSADSIVKAAKLLQEGELVAFPTETVYGLGANALNFDAVNRIFKLKGRPSSNPLIVHVPDIASFHSLTCCSLQQKQWLIRLESIWPGPLTVVLPSAHRIAANVSAGLNTIALRIPSHPIALELLRKVALPIAAPSANRSTYISPTSADHVDSEFGEGVPLILDGGRCEVGVESTVLSLIDDSPTILRHGAVTREQLSELLDIQIAENTLSHSPISPGQMAHHYAPRTALIFRHEVQGTTLPSRTGLVSFGSDPSSGNEQFAAVRCVSQNGDLNEVAHNLFWALRELDNLSLDLIVVDSCELHGIGNAIMDRLQRAAATTTIQQGNFGRLVTAA